MTRLTLAQIKNSAKNAVIMAKKIENGAPLELRVYNEREGSFVESADKNAVMFEFCSLELHADDLKSSNVCTKAHILSALKRRGIEQELVDYTTY